MKKLVFAFMMFFGAVAVVNAQDSTSTASPTDPASTSTVQTATQEEGRVKIKSQELPEAVKSSLESQEYRGWLVNSAYKMEGSTTSTSASTSSSSSSSDSTSVSGDTNTNTTATEATAQEVYIVELKNGAQSKTVRFDKDGKKLDDEGANTPK